MKNKDNRLDPKRITQYIEDMFHRMGVKLVYSALLLFFAYSAKETPGWAKKVIIGALAYFVSPIDGIPDLSPFLGFTDDMGILSYGIVMIACYIDESIRTKAKEKVYQIFNEIDEKDLSDVDRSL